MANDVNSFIAAIVQQESGGNYHAVSKDGALGRYQIMPSNIPSWSKEVLGHSVTPAEFMADPVIQDIIGKAKLTALFNQYGARGAAAAWYSGSAANANNYGSDNGGAGSAGAYADSVLAHMGNPNLALANSSGGSVATAATASAAAATETPAQLKADLIDGMGALKGLLNVVPELKNILTLAVNKGWTAAEFTNAVDNSTWYRTHSDTVKSNIALQASDPAEYKVKLDQASAHVRAFMQQYGVNPSQAAFNNIVNGYFLNGRNDDQLLQYIQAHEATIGFSGGAVQSAGEKVKQVAADYGMPLTRAGLNSWAEKIGLGQSSIDVFTEQAKNTAKSLYPSLSTQLDGGMTMKTIADPYIQTKANLLEINPNTIDWTKDATIRAALQGAPSATKGQPPTATPLYQFESQVRADPRWQMTLNAHQATSQLLKTLGTDWGFQ